MSVRAGAIGLGRHFVAIGIAAGGMLLVTDSAIAQTLGRVGDDGVSLWRVSGALLLCLALAVAAAFVLRTRLGHLPLPALMNRRQRRLALVESLRLGPQTSLALVVCDGRELLVLCSGQSAELVGHLPLGSQTSRTHTPP